MFCSFLSIIDVSKTSIDYRASYRCLTARPFNRGLLTYRGSCSTNVWGWFGGKTRWHLGPALHVLTKTERQGIEGKGNKTIIYSKRLFVKL